MGAPHRSGRGKERTRHAAWLSAALILTGSTSLAAGVAPASAADGSSGGKKPVQRLWKQYPLNPSAGRLVKSHQGRTKAPAVQKVVPTAAGGSSRPWAIIAGLFILALVICVAPNVLRHMRRKRADKGAIDVKFRHKNEQGAVPQESRPDPSAAVAGLDQTRPDEAEATPSRREPTVDQPVAAQASPEVELADQNVAPHEEGASEAAPESRQPETDPAERLRIAADEAKRRA